jgi:hypothetical protein
MDDCPHCGEPIDEDAESCPHCGSDAETGWMEDADDASVDLPEDEPLVDGGLPPPGPQPDTAVAWIALAAAAGAFLWLGSRVHGALILPFLALLAGAFFFERRRRRRPRA